MKANSIFKPRIFESLKDYSFKKFTADFMAGIIVGIVAIPLAIAFGIASGVGPAEGIITAIIAGFIISFFGGTKVQIGGPTGAFIVIVYGIIEQHGILGLTIATIMAGIMLVLMGVFKLGSIIKFIPYPVIIGFTGGIAVTIFSTQMNDLFGLGLTNIPADFIHKWAFYFEHFKDINPSSTIVGLSSLLIIMIMPKISKKVPASLVAIITSTLVVYLLKEFSSLTATQDIKTIGDLYTLPQGIPSPSIPEINLSEGETFIGVIQTLFPAAFTIAILGAIESLLSAVVADGVTNDKHDSNTELIGQGIANIVVPFFGGIPATGAIARTMTNINNGGKTPIAGIIHTIVLTLALLCLGKLIMLIPMPCLAAVLVIVSYNMSGWRNFVSLSKNPTSDFIVLMTTFILTVIFDLTIAIEIGLIIATVSFIKRTSETASIKAFQHEIDPSHDTDITLHEETLKIPESVEVYEIDGPYFFGIANKFEEVMKVITDQKPKVRIIRMRKVPFIDSTGIHNLESLVINSQKKDIKIILSGVNKEVHKTLVKTDFNNLLADEYICSNINEALAKAETLI